MYPFEEIGLRKLLPPKEIDQELEEDGSPVSLRHSVSFPHVQNMINRARVEQSDMRVASR